ncbi:unnamed protein product [Protopolystoma xenopodis]|uniref:Uncharacterized protein n=1 Tax=Protopolystoma xenopodis TaxID=117903 RepID=A0A448XJU4_9PLAT|nr:unnamed protein product [Protopolystoma xenopodis]
MYLLVYPKKPSDSLHLARPRSAQDGASDIQSERNKKVSVCQFPFVRAGSSARHTPSGRSVPVHTLACKPGTRAGDPHGTVYNLIAVFLSPVCRAEVVFAAGSLLFANATTATATATTADTNINADSDLCLDCLKMDPHDDDFIECIRLKCPNKISFSTFSLDLLNFYPRDVCFLYFEVARQIKSIRKISQNISDASMPSFDVSADSEWTWMIQIHFSCSRPIELY